MANKPKKKEVYDPSFYKLAKEVTAAIERNKDETDQKQQVEELLDAEIKFKEAILKYNRQSTEIYKKFVQMVCDVNKNILSARPYFRESAVNFAKNVTPAIKLAANKDMTGNRETMRQGIEDLKKFDINFQFIRFIHENWLGPFPEHAELAFQRVYKARKILIENNMPLAINRAKLFFRKTPESHLSLMDMIGICGMGLAAGIDKYCGTYSPVFRSVCIGRMVGNLIDDYSETVLHFYPSDKRILYKAHTIRARQGIDNIEELTAAVNQSFEEDANNKAKEDPGAKPAAKIKVTVSELSDLMSAASMVSADQTVSVTEDGEIGVYDYTADETQDIEGLYMERETTAQMLALAAKLPLMHRKILKLKGIKL